MNTFRTAWMSIGIVMVAMVLVFVPANVSQAQVTCPSGYHVASESETNLFCSSDTDSDVKVFNKATGQNAESDDLGGFGKILSGLGYVIAQGIQLGGGLILPFIISGLIFIAATILTIASGAFDFLLLHTVVQFGDILTRGSSGATVLDGISIAWSAFRDLANILIIGFFTFIAISMILGLKEYGNGRLIVRVLVVAILINFSLLFTKVVIDVSNFAAAQIYSSATELKEAKLDGAPAAGAPSTSTSVDGIAGTLLRYMKTTTFSQTSEQVNVVHQRNGLGVLTLYGILMFTLLMTAAVVLFYGSFLLVARVVAFVVVMLTASLAFALYLLPGIADEHFTKWRTALIQNAILAPAMLLLLWGTLLVAKNIQISDAEGSLAGVAAGTVGAGDFAALFSYLIILGLLFASFKISSDFATSLGGWRWGVAPFTLGSKFIGAPIARATLGRFAAGQQDAAIGRARGYTAQAGRLEEQGKFEEASRLHAKARRTFESSKRWGSLATSNFNVMDTKLAKTLDKKTGLSKGGAVGSAFAGTSPEKGPKGYLGRVEEQAKAANEVAKALAPNKDAIKASIEKDRQAGTQQLEAAKKIADQAHETITAQKEDRDAREQQLRKLIEEQVIKNGPEQKELDALNSDAAHQERIQRLRDQEESLRQQLGSTFDATRRGEIEVEIRNVAGQRTSEMNTQKNRIEAAQKAIDERRANILAGAATNIDAVNQAVKDFRAIDERLRQGPSLAEAKKAADEATKALNAHNAETNKLVDIQLALQQRGVDGVRKAAALHNAGVADSDIIIRGASTADRHTGYGTADRVADKARSLFKGKKPAAARLKDILKDENLLDDEKKS